MVASTIRLETKSAKKDWEATKAEIPQNIKLRQTQRGNQPKHQQHDNKKQRADKIWFKQRTNQDVNERRIDETEVNLKNGIFFDDRQDV